jgi:L-asparaginase
LHADGFSAFESPNFGPLMEVGIHIETVNGQVTENIEQPLTVCQVKSQPIGVVPLYPGIGADVLRNTIQQPVNALILLSYGVGNAPNNRALLDELDRAKANNIIVLNCTQCLKGKVNMDGYASGKILKQVGVVSGRDMTLEAALAKLHYLLSSDLSTEEIRYYLGENLRGELTV